MLDIPADWRLGGGGGGLFILYIIFLYFDHNENDFALYNIKSDNKFS